jgi:hypothetical protein
VTSKPPKLRLERPSEVPSKNALRDDDASLDRRVNAMLRRDAKAFERQVAREDAADRLVGELCREGKVIFYVNLRDRSGRLTGKTKEDTRLNLVAYLIRNRYV